ncbi:DUF2975 domain-containing protein [Streptomyces sp. NPDC049813]|uniref:DUF2975 domain-containing protein n=1 Tax=Streptomyces sp. NPDC049813 TaxID=3365597 RepID=UPI0037B500A2
MGSRVVFALRGVIVALLAGCVAVQAVLATLVVQDATDVGGDGVPRVPVLLIVVVGMVCAEVVLVCVWRLLALVRRGEVFTASAFRYVDVAGGAFAAAALLLWALGVVLAPGETVAPGVVLLIGAVGLGVLAVALIVWIMRALLAQAVARDAEACRMQAELAGVI